MAAHFQDPLESAGEWEERLSSPNPTPTDQVRGGKRSKWKDCVRGCVNGVREQVRGHEGAGWGPEQPQPAYLS